MRNREESQGVLTKPKDKENSAQGYLKKENFSTTLWGWRIFIFGALSSLLCACGHEGKPPHPEGEKALARRYPKPSVFEGEQTKGQDSRSNR
jgi:hypothetical protein